MIRRKMKSYDYYRYDSENDYGEQVLNKDTSSKYVRMSIELASKAVIDDIRYTDTQYVGFIDIVDFDYIDENCVIVYDGQKGIYLKVLKVIPSRRYAVVYLKEVSI